MVRLIQFRLLELIKKRLIEAELCVNDNTRNIEMQMKSQ